MCKGILVIYFGNEHIDLGKEQISKFLATIDMIIINMILMICSQHPLLKVGDEFEMILMIRDGKAGQHTSFRPAPSKPV